MALSAANLAELEARGFTVVAGFAGRSFTRRARALADRLFGPGQVEM
jgi:hypothetical protein